MPRPTEYRLSSMSPVTQGTWYVAVLKDGSERPFMAPEDGRVADVAVPYLEQYGLDVLGVYTCDTLSRRVADPRGF